MQSLCKCKEEVGWQIVAISLPGKNKVRVSGLLVCASCHLTHLASGTNFQVSFSPPEHKEEISTVQIS